MATKWDEGERRAWRYEAIWFFLGFTVLFTANPMYGLAYFAGWCSAESGRLAMARARRRRIKQIVQAEVQEVRGKQ